MNMQSGVVDGSQSNGGLPIGGEFLHLLFNGGPDASSIREVLDRYIGRDVGFQPHGGHLRINANEQRLSGITNGNRFSPHRQCGISQPRRWRTNEDLEFFGLAIAPLGGREDPRDMNGRRAVFLPIGKRKAIAAAVEAGHQSAWITINMNLKVKGPANCARYLGRKLGLGNHRGDRGLFRRLADLRRQRLTVPDECQRLFGEPHLFHELTILQPHAKRQLAIPKARLHHLQEIIGLQHLQLNPFQKRLRFALGAAQHEQQSAGDVFTLVHRLGATGGRRGGRRRGARQRHFDSGLTSAQLQRRFLIGLSDQILAQDLHGIRPRLRQPRIEIGRRAEQLIRQSRIEQSAGRACCKHGHSIKSGMQPLFVPRQVRDIELKCFVAIGKEVQASPLLTMRKPDPPSRAVEVIIRRNGQLNLIGAGQKARRFRRRRRSAAQSELEHEPRPGYRLGSPAAATLGTPSR